MSPRLELKSPGNFAKKRGVIKLVAQFRNLCLAIESLNVRTNSLRIVQFAVF